MKKHSLKISPVHFDPVFTGRKTAELRINDREFKANDILHLQEYTNNKFTGSCAWRRVTHVADVDDHAPGHVLLSMVPATPWEIEGVA